MKTRLITTLIGCLMLFGCQTQSTTTTAPLSSIVTTEVKVPVATCPKEIEQVVMPTRPTLEIDQLTQADIKDYDKVGKAYMSSIKSLKQYAQELESVAYGTRDICRTVNTTISGK